MTGTDVSRKEACSLKESSASPKSIMKIGMWNVPNRENRSCSKRDEEIYIDVLGITVCRWAGFGRMRTQTGETFLFSGRDDDAHLSGVAMLLSTVGRQSAV